MTGFCTWRGPFTDDGTDPDVLPLIMSTIGCMGIRFKLVGDSFALAHHKGKDAIAARVSREDMEILKAEKPRIVAWLKSRPAIYQLPPGPVPVGTPTPANWQEFAARIGIQWAVDGMTDWLHAQAAQYGEAIAPVDAMRSAFRDLDQWQQGEDEL